MTLTAFLTVVGIHVLAAMSPSPSFVVCVRAAAAQGFWTAAALALGFGIGAGLWAAAALMGLAVLFELVPAAFVAFKVLGRAYLLWIALAMWRQAAAPLQSGGGLAPRSVLAAVRFGLLTFVTNPKPAVFFGAVFVGLVPPETALLWKAAIVLALAVNEMLWYLVVARAFSLARPRAAYLRLKVATDRLFGALLAALGLRIALT